MVLLAIILFLAGCQPAHRPDVLPGGQIFATVSVSATATLPPSPVPAKPSPAPTQTALPTPDLAASQLQRLYEASLNYLAQTDAETWQVAGSLGYAPLGGYPSNMCGPLAISILKDAGIVSQTTDLHDFWLLNPEEDVQLLQSTFPVDHFEWLHSDQPIDQIDYSQFPLKAGDLVYIYSGIQGDYSHVLVVTRIDSDGRAYTVTNNYTEAGFVVLEYLLYDPTVPGNGIFYTWPDPANRDLGLTGFGGMDIWRLISLPYYADGAP
ncbi:MAG: hypothetical protein A2X27_02255 [Chloroflexi bacterium GWD2_49_16]|nr:MAG: hypothetical protein A2X26_06655 [Chloroflexi bacterium GWC2_49_37]OGN83836.1 MAG: hypothetical protein A2X27_02255 [Chloroflexi bacterium GWD2_49_16]